MDDDPEYTNVGPYAICVVLQEEHGRLIADSDWPALATKLPESNEVTPEEAIETPQKQIQCFKCKQWGHKANHPACPLYSKKPTTRPTQEQMSERRLKEKDPWKYIEPKDLTKPVVIDDKEWYFCTKCRCRATGQVGFYQLSHTDATHNPHWPRAPESNTTQVTDPDPTPLPPRHPLREPMIDDDLVFTGVHCCPVVLNPPTPDERKENRTMEKVISADFKHPNGDKRLHIINTIKDKTVKQQELSVNLVYSENNIPTCSTSQRRPHRLYASTTRLFLFTWWFCLAYMSRVRSCISTGWDILQYRLGRISRYVLSKCTAFGNEVLITGKGNVAWTLSCDNGDQVTIITRCYLVPTASTRLLSEDQFHLEYRD